jgi:outer membrane lipoprotein-sorting protein
MRISVLNSRLGLAILLVAVALISGCATARPVPDSALATPGAVVETLSSTVAISLRTAEKNIAGRGVMVYRRPDQLRLIMLSPLGTTVMDTLVSGDRLTIAYPPDGVAFTGNIADLPASAGREGWAMMRWVLDSDLPKDAPLNGVFERVGKNGRLEKVTVKKGVVFEKSMAGGEQVKYREHQLLGGIWLPLELQMQSAEGDRIRLTLEEPDLNTELDGQAFTQPLSGFKLYPLSKLKGQ